MIGTAMPQIGHHPDGLWNTQQGETNSILGIRCQFQGRVARLQKAYLLAQFTLARAQGEVSFDGLAVIYDKMIIHG